MTRVEAQSLPLPLERGKRSVHVPASMPHG